MRDFLFKVALEVKPSDMTEKEFEHSMKFGGIEKLVQKKEWEKEIIEFLKKNPKESCPKIARSVGAPTTLVYKIKREVLKG